MISKFFTTTFTTKRQEFSGDSSALISKGTFIGHIQQGTPENYQEYIGFRLTKAFTVWCPSDTDVQEGDRIEQGSNRYDVRFLINRDINSSRNAHLQLILEELDG